ncbi:MAG: hemolysin family protein [Turicibacter sp.]|nr:hemolysin family protein [Turicibacter sp.]
MDPSINYVLLFVLLLLSAFFSSTETAFSSANLIRLRQYADEGRRGAKEALAVLEKFDEFLLTTLIGNNVVNISAASIGTILASQMLGDDNGAVVATGVLTVVITIFGEILPKNFARDNAERVAAATGKIFRFLMTILWPITFVLKKLTDLMKHFSKREEEPSVTEDELNVIIDTMEEEGVLEEEEVDMLQGVLDMSETFVKDIMTPRVDVIALEEGASFDDIKRVFLEEKYSRVPVYRESRDNILGVLYERDLFSYVVEGGSLETAVITDLMREATYVSDSMRVSSLLTKLQVAKQHLAIVVDEYGGTAGVVTMEDVLEEVVGEIYDEHDDEEAEGLLKKHDNLYEIRAEMEVEHLFDSLEIELAVPEEVHSLGGWIFSKIEDIPKIGDVYNYHHLEFTVIDVEGRRIKRLQLEIKPGTEITSE